MNDAPSDSSSHLNSLGLSDCKYTPPLIEFTEQDPLGKSNIQTNFVNSLTKDSDDYAQIMAVTKSLGQQADSLTDQKARLYALERMYKAIRIKVSRKIVFSVLDAMVRTLSFDEINTALNDLEVDDVQSLIDFMKMYQQVGNVDSNDAAQDGNVGRNEAGWEVISVIIKVIICQNQQALEDVAKYCIEMLLSEAKGEMMNMM